ncbi:NTF2-like N-terminal transpeptidase domain-containing protein [Nonomuraea sp. NPDC051191]|uniref:NTF2-like N-terminal transpeptidase domain-containing protein n=1 Tax=Nonomuraea sp. NPDC051191 TaxID=3364372 RepID=UPI0037A8E17E
MPVCRTSSPNEATRQVGRQAADLRADLGERAGVGLSAQGAVCDGRSRPRTQGRSGSGSECCSPANRIARYARIFSPTATDSDHHPRSPDRRPRFGHCVHLTVRTKGSPQQTATAFLTAWQRGDLSALKAQVLELPRDLDGVYNAFTKGSQAKRMTIQDIRVHPKAYLNVGETATYYASFAVTLDGPVPYSYDGQLEIMDFDRAWKVSWSPTAIHPELQRSASARCGRSASSSNATAPPGSSFWRHVPRANRQDDFSPTKASNWRPFWPTRPNLGSLVSRRCEDRFIARHHTPSYLAEQVNGCNRLAEAPAVLGRCRASVEQKAR